jgi:hypothetical protein
MVQLIDLDFARQHVPAARDQDEPILNALIDNASRAVQRYCRRDFLTTTYDELYDGTDEPVLLLRQYPVLSVQSVRTGLVPVLQIQNANTTQNQQARVSVTSSGLTLKRVASGTATTSTLTFAANPTLTALAAAVTALGNGWTGQVAESAFANFPSADLLAPQGAYDARGRAAPLLLHGTELQDFDIDTDRGWLVKTATAVYDAAFWGNPLWLEPVWCRGLRNYRVQYTAGYVTVPEDVGEACAELVASWFAARGRDVFLAQESITGSNSYITEATQGRLPARVQALLRPYRNYRG